MMPSFAGGKQLGLVEEKRRTLTTFAAELSSEC